MKKIIAVGIFWCICLEPCGMAIACDIGDDVDAYRTPDDVPLIIEEGSFREELRERIAVEADTLTLYSYLHNYRGSQKSDDTLTTRVLLSAAARLVDKVSFKTTLSFWHMWRAWKYEYLTGRPQSNAPDNDQWTFANAYLRGNDLIDGLTVEIGRMFIGEAEDPFFYYGPHKGLYLELTALDAFRTELELGKIVLVGLAGRQADMHTGLAMEDDRDANIFGVQAASDELLPGHFLRTALYYRWQSGDINGRSDNLFLWTCQADGETPIEGLEYGLALGIDFGKNNDTDQKYFGWLGRIKGDYEINLDFTDLLLNAGYVYVSGDDNPDDSTDHNFHRISRDCFFSMALITYELLNDSFPEAVTNVVIPYCGVEVIPAVLDHKLTLGVRAAWLDTAKPIAGLDRKGDEVNIYAEYDVTEDISFELVGARFWPDGILEQLWGKDPIDQISLYGTLNF